MRIPHALALATLCAINLVAFAEETEPGTGVILSADRLPPTAGLLSQRDETGFAKLNYMLKALVLDQAKDPGIFSLEARTTPVASEYARQLPTKGGLVLVAIYLDAENAAETRRQLAQIPGSEVLAAAPAKGGWWLVNALVPVESLVAVASVPGVTSVTPSFPPVSASAGSTRASGLATSQAETILGAARARTLFPEADGRGIRIGVISDSADAVDSNGDLVGGVAESIARGDLPGDGRAFTINEPTTTLSPWTDEGRAMGEVIYDVLPGVEEIVFASGLDGEAEMASSINLLSLRGCSIIVDDLIFAAEPLFEQGPIGEAVSRYAMTPTSRYGGGFYFGAAGNYTTNARRFDDLDSDGDNFYEFDGSAGELMQVTIAPNTTARFFLHWTSPFKDSKSSFAIEAYDMSNNFLGSSGPSGLGTTAFNVLVYQTGAGPNPTRIRLAVKWIEGLRDCQYQLQGTPGISNMTMDSYPEAFAGFISPHVGILPEAFAVAAHDKENIGLPATYSSLGPYNPVFVTSDGQFFPGEAMQKPDFASLAGCDTSFFGSPDTDGSGFPNFYGTSCAAPNLAATTAMMLGVLQGEGSGITYREVGDLLKVSASDGALPAWNVTSGFGFVNSLRAVLGAAIPVGTSVAAYPNQFGISQATFELPPDAPKSVIAWTSTNTGDPINVSVSANELVLAAYNPDTGLPWLTADSAAAASGSYIPNFGTPNTIVQVVNRDPGEPARSVTVRVTSKPINAEELFPTIADEAFSAANLTQFGTPVYLFKVAGDGGAMHATASPDGGLDAVLVAYNDAGDQIGYSDHDIAGVAESLTVTIPTGSHAYFLVAPYRYASTGSFTFSAKRLLDAQQPTQLAPLPSVIGGVMHPNALSGETAFPGPQSSQDPLELGLGVPGHLMFEANGTDLRLSSFVASDSGIFYSLGLYNSLGTRLSYSEASGEAIQQFEYSGLVPGDEYYVRMVPLTGDGFFYILGYSETPSAFVGGRVATLNGIAGDNKAIYQVTGNINMLGENDYYEFTLPGNAQFPFTATVTPTTGFDAEFEIGAVNNYLETGVVDSGLAGVAETAHQVSPNQSARRTFVVRVSTGEADHTPGPHPNAGAYTLRIEVPTNGAPVLVPPIVAALLGADGDALDLDGNGIIDAADVVRFFGG